MSKYSNNELHEHKVADTIKWIVVFVLLFAIIGTVICLGLQISGVFDKQNKAPTDSAAENLQQQGALNFSFQDSDPDRAPVGGIEAVTLGYGEAVAAASGDSISKQLTATVMPVDAPDKSCDWAVEWIEPLDGDFVVTDYITVEPTSDGATTANVVCHKGFEGASIRVTVTTRVGSFQAFCIVRYEGAPQILKFTYNDSTESAIGYVQMSVGQTHDVALSLDNTLHAVGSKYNQFEITKIAGIGKFNATRYYLVNGSKKAESDVVIDLSNPTWTGYDSLDYSLKTTETLDLSTFLTAKVEGSTLKVTPLQPISALYKASRSGNGLKYKSPYQDPRSSSPTICYIAIHVQEKLSGKTAIINVEIISTVNSVSVSDDFLTF